MWRTDLRLSKSNAYSDNCWKLCVICMKTNTFIGILNLPTYFWIIILESNWLILAWPDVLSHLYWITFMSKHLSCTVFLRLFFRFVVPRLYLGWLFACVVDFPLVTNSVSFCFSLWHGLRLVLRRWLVWVSNWRSELVGCTLMGVAITAGHHRRSSQTRSLHCGIVHRRS